MYGRSDEPQMLAARTPCAACGDNLFVVSTLSGSGELTAKADAVRVSLVPSTAQHGQLP